MQDPGVSAPGEDEALAWRSAVALRLSRAFVLIFVCSAAVIWFAMAAGGSRNTTGALRAGRAVPFVAIVASPGGRAALRWAGS